MFDSVDVFTAQSFSGYKHKKKFFFIKKQG